ncbi:hypothetical protein F4813DRAFT_401039 [Daldinia decipiens]|uniref:uncharacterized protein n=1 Tax=Daldinia decipiens TaxID=326647 RepID=UPI0020C34111|nr:uncharacterized protein F4813DRAFT_401039 [Daldinia decipiens]KAI1660038.1 hypothetical protein F4813DRAFT_401039 [Daldinia decipiens]
MDHHRLPRHSSSHGTLYSSYSHGRSTHGPSPVRPLHKPLRSVNENSVLLPSPGALESMLKTTTETGDIGIFSIKPVPPLPQRRGTFSKISQQRPSPRPSVEELQRRNNGKIPLCRDTASEIISMHDSESHKSTTSTLTPTCSEDIGLRSYSMTTCGSRHLSHHKSTTTLQSQASGGLLQRPRSPFPYPTRLKRPGVRPASPALTENGRVDYSRMVEIDRASYRTVHGPYKPSYPPTPRRPPPLGLRADANLSTVSLPSQGLPPLSRHRPPRPSSIRTHSTASMASYNAPYRERFDSSSSRTSSLTSIVNMYHRTPHTPRIGPSGLSTTVPRYYDYTEGFESRQPRAITPVQPFAPVPTRISNCHRPLVLQDSDENLAVVFGERDSAFFEAGSSSPGMIDGLEALSDTNGCHVENYQATVDRVSSRCRTGSIRSDSRFIAFDGLEVDMRLEKGSDIDLLPSQVGRDSMDTFNPSLDLESKDAPTYRYTDYRLTATPRTKANSPERQVQVLGGRAPTIRSEQGVILRDDTQGETLNEDDVGESGVGDIVEGQANRSLQDHSIIKRPCSEPTQELSRSYRHETEYETQNGFGTIARAYSDCGRTAIRSSDPGMTVIGGSDIREYNTRDSVTFSANREDWENKHGGVRDGNTISSSATQTTVVQRQRFQRHKRNQAVPRISTSSLPRDDNEGFPYISPSCSTTPIVSPKPISPARQLKLKNSIPQLMKALPPLPGDPDYMPPPTPSIQSTSSRDTEFVEVLAPFKFSRSPTLHQFKDAVVVVPERNLKDNRAIRLHKSAPKLRLRIKTSNSSEAAVAPGTGLHNDGMGRYWPSGTPNTYLGGQNVDSGIRTRSRNKLRLRSSRSTVDSTAPSARVRRNVDGEALDHADGITRQKPRDLFTFSTNLSPTPSSTNGKSPQPRCIEDSSARGTSGIDPPSGIAPQFEQRTSLENREARNKPLYDSRSLETRASSNVRQPRGLRRRLSDLHCLLARHPGPASTITDTTIEQEGKENKTDRGVTPSNINIVSRQSASRDEQSIRGNHGRAGFSRRVRSKILKWVKNAKTAVRACAKKNRDA